MDTHGDLQATVVGCLEGGAAVVRFGGLWRIHAPLSGESVSATSASNFTDLVPQNLNSPGSLSVTTI